MDKAGAADLVSRILHNDQEAEEELVRRYRGGMLAIVRRLLGNDTAAEDVAQESLAVAIVKVRSGAVTDPASLSSFLCSVARNIAIGYVRTARREQPGEFEVTDPASGALESLLARERANAVRQVLAELTPRRDREVLYRFYIAEEPKAAICADLGLSSLHFNRVIYRARERFREIYEAKRRQRDIPNPGARRDCSGPE